MNESPKPEPKARDTLEAVLFGDRLKEAAQPAMLAAIVLGVGLMAVMSLRGRG